MVRGPFFSTPDDEGRKELGFDDFFICPWAISSSCGAIFRDIPPRTSLRRKVGLLNKIVQLELLLGVLTVICLEPWQSHEVAKI